MSSPVRTETMNFSTVLATIAAVLRSDWGLALKDAALFAARGVAVLITLVSLAQDAIRNPWLLIAKPAKPAKEQIVTVAAMAVKEIPAIAQGKVKEVRPGVVETFAKAQSLTVKEMRKLTGIKSTKFRRIHLEATMFAMV